MSIIKKGVFGLLKDPRYLAIIALFFIVVVLLIIDPFADIRSFEIEDKCGRFMNLISHTIETKSSCEIRCRANCEAQEYLYHKINFKNNEPSCNLCTCYCKVN